MWPPKHGAYANSSLMIYALMWFSLAATIEAIDTPLPLSLGEYPHFHDSGAESFSGLTGYTRNYYGPTTTTTTGGVASLAVGGGIGDDLATYGNYAHKLLNHHHHPPLPHQQHQSFGSTANGFVPFYYNSKLHSQFSEDVDANAETEARQPGDIDFVINAANYDPNTAGYEAEAELQKQLEPQHHHQHPHQTQFQGNYAYRPRVSFPTSPSNHYQFEQISNYQENRENRQQHRHQEEREEDIYARIKGLQELANTVKREQQDTAASSHQTQQNQHQSHQHYLPEQPIQKSHVKYNVLDQRQQQRSGNVQDQQLLYSNTDTRIADLPPVTTSVHHTPSSSKAVAGLPLAKHIEVTRNIPVTHYQKQHVPYKQTVQMQVPKTVIAAIPKPTPIKVPVAKTVAVPQLQEVKIPIERVKPVPVERPIPFVVERRVPYRVEKPVATPVYYPYPVKVPVVRTVVHKQRPHYVAPGWSATGNHLLG
ncbi:uncharacterized protein Dana_GF18280 [Drosophila ananassae]|uniref:DUF4794 domain-containing protein n=1 Tax=Drosophila ananassae TaxID=7217 RepID=B3LZB0_DROAN|nr:transcription factor SPT20 homolog [Drosophila ananassae]EDV43037.2 uncharacterized protein Dana_GF18280 [Drosophila ananassae]